MTLKTQKFILLVEDEALIAMMEMRELKEIGYQVIHVLNGERAIERVRTDCAKIDLILMDIDLGHGIDGVETATEILKDFDIPIVFLSSHTERDIVEKTEQVTSYGYVVKNTGITVLDASIKMAFKLFNAHKQMYKEKEYLKITLNSIGDAVIATDSEGKITRMNPIAESLTGWTTEEAQDQSIAEVFKIVNAKTRSEVENPIKKVLETGAVVGLANHTLLISKSGEEYQIADSGAPIRSSEGQILGIILVFRDVTEEYRIQDALQKSEMRYRSLSTNLEAGIVVHAYDTSIIMNNAKAQEILGLTDAQMRGKTAIDPVWRFVDENGIPLSLEAYPVNRIAKNKSSFKNQIIGIERPDKTELVWVTCNGFPVFNERSKVEEIIISFFDITEKKTAEKKLKESEERFKALFSSMTELVVLHELVFNEKEEAIDYRIIDCNNMFTEVTGIEKEQAIGKLASEVYQTENPPFLEIYSQVAITGKPEKYTTYYEPMDKHFIISIVSPKKNQFATVTTDITERKLTEIALQEKNEEYAALNDALRILVEELRVKEEEMQQKEIAILESEERFRALHNASFGGICIHDKGLILECNQGLSEMYGYSYDELIGMDGLKLIAPFNRDLVLNNILSGYEKPYEAVGMRKNGELFPMRLEARNVPYKGKNTRTVEFRDITESKQAEINLKKSERDLRESQRIAHVGSWNLDIATNQVIWSEELYNMYGFDPSLPPPPFNEHMKLFTPDSWERLFSALTKTRDLGIPYTLELETIRKDGRNGWMWVHGEATFDANGQIVGLWGAAQDITERKLIEEKIKSLLLEKELILKEVHHRIKNNMYTIKSLLSLQANTMTDPSGINALKDAESRVQSMMLLYDKLYMSSEYGTISFKEFMTPLVDQIINNFPNREIVSVSTDISDIILETKITSILGIIVNELLTNIMKYAFNGKTGGVIQISCFEKNHQITLIVQDNGNGIPESVDFENSTGFGLMLIRILTEQLKGTIRIERENGTKVILEF